MLKLTFCPRNYRTLLTAAIGVLCLLPFQAKAQRPAATLIEMVGQVSVQEGPGSYKALFLNNPVHSDQMIVTGPNSYARFQMPDHSTFEVFENATVKFTPNWPSWSDLLEVVLGRVKVFIDHSHGPNHNSIKTPTAIISVRGTYFDVVVEDSDGTTLVSVENGRVQVQATTAASRDVFLDAGQSVRVFRNQPFGMKGTQIDRLGLAQKVLKATQDAVRQILIGRGGSPGIGSVGGPAGGPQGDKKGNTGSASGAPAPPPPPPPGGGGGN